MLFLARAIDAVRRAGNLSLAQAYISDITKPEERTKSFGIIGIAFALGFLIGPAISGFLAQYSFRYPIFGAALLSATSIATTWFLLPSVKPGAAGQGRGSGPGGKRLSLVDWGSYAVYFRQPLLASRLWQFFLFSLGFALFTSGLPLFLERRLTWDGAPFGPKQVGYTWALAGFFGIFWQGPALGKLAKRFGESLLNRVGFIGYVIGYTVLAFCRSVASLGTATAVMSMGSLVRPALTSLITQAAPADEQGVVLGLTQSLTSVALIIGPLTSGYLIEKGLLTTWSLVAASITFVGLLLAMRPTKLAG